MDKYNYPVVDLTVMSTSEPGVFCGGDLANVASTTVESVNDGKTAAWHIHRYIQVRLEKLNNTCADPSLFLRFSG